MLGVALLALVLTLGFSRESYALWPLFTLLDFPGQVGRALAFLTQGQSVALVLGPAHEVRFGGPPSVELLAGAAGLGLALAAGALCLFLAPRAEWRRPALLAAAVPLILGGSLPPYDILRTPAPIVAGLVLLVLTVPRFASQAERALQLIAMSFLLAPLWEMREPLFVSGSPGMDLALLEAGSGVPATAWCVIGLAVAGGLCVWLVGLPEKPAGRVSEGTSS